MFSMLRFLYEYFPNVNKNNEDNCAKIPYSISFKYNHIPWATKKQLIDIRADLTIEIELFNEKELTEFLLKRQQEYPFISKTALFILTPFTSTYLCETAFSQLKITKKHYAFNNNLYKQTCVF